MRLLAYRVMPNRWQLVVWPRQDGARSRFMNWLTLTYTQRWHQHRHSVGDGHVYQGRFKSFPAETNEYLLMVCRYVERNPVRTGFVERAEQWHWSSAWQRGLVCVVFSLSVRQVEPPTKCLQWVNEDEINEQFAAMRRSVTKGQTYGSEREVEKMAVQ
jgi:putative transposase